MCIQPLYQSVFTSSIYRPLTLARGELLLSSDSCSIIRAKITRAQDELRPPVHVFMGGARARCIMVQSGQLMSCIKNAALTSLYNTEALLEFNSF